MEKLRITDTTLRDGQQSLLATRMKTADLKKIAKKMDKIGFHSMEVWGGATFDVCLRFLNEDPWQRLKTFKKLLPSTPLQMLLRGQNLVGYRHYPDDVVRAFVFYASECGIEIFRIFDALNDERNLACSLKAVKDCGKHAQLAICYSLTEEKMGGTIYNLDYFLEKAEIFQQIGADSICIKDMAGILAPDDACRLIKALKKNLRIPIQLHCHCTSGLAPETYLKAIKSGIDILDTALAPLAMGYSQPAIEPILATLRGTARDLELDLNYLLKLDKKLKAIVAKYQGLPNAETTAIQKQTLSHQIPGGMITSLISQLEEINQLNRLEEVLKEVPRVRKEFGYPPLVTPTSQIIGVQAIQNVILGRYKLISQQARDFLCGFYGKPPAPINSEIQKKALKGYKKQPITCRPADLLQPEMEKTATATEGIARNHGDILIYALYDKGLGMDFLKRKYKKED